MARHQDKRTKAQQIAHEIRALIMNGELEPGERLPTTAALEKRFDTYSVTIQRALTLLKDEGLIEGRHGAGVFVHDRPLLTVVPASYVAPTAADERRRWSIDPSRRSTNRVLDVGEAAPPKAVARAMGLLDGEVAVFRVRLGLLDGEPAEVTHSYYPSEIARGTRLADRRRIPGGAPALLAELGYPVRAQYDEVSTRMATPEEYVLLELPGDVPLLDIFRVVVSDELRPVEVTMMVKPGHLYKMGYELTNRREVAPGG